MFPDSVRAAVARSSKRWNEAENVMQTVTITIICQSNGMFTVGRDVGPGQGGIAFAKREAADAYAMRLQEESGGPIMAKITVHDHTKESRA
jgi:hypothetical protein